MVNRIDFIKDALEINSIQAMIISEMISDIADDDLTKFLVFRMDFIQPMKSKDLITKEALYAYKRMRIERDIANGICPFTDKNSVHNYLQSFYKGREIANGAGNYKDFVVIALDKDGEYINKYAVNEHGSYKKLISSDVDNVLEWLLNNPTRIGNIKRVKETNVPIIGHKKEEISNDVNPRVLQNLKVKGM